MPLPKKVHILPWDHCVCAWLSSLVRARTNLRLRADVNFFMLKIPKMPYSLTLPAREAGGCHGFRKDERRKLTRGFFRVVVWGSAMPNIHQRGRAGKGDVFQDRGQLFRYYPPTESEDMGGARVLVSTGLTTKAGVLVWGDRGWVFQGSRMAQPTPLKTNFRNVIKQTRIFI